MKNKHYISKALVGLLSTFSLVIIISSVALATGATDEVTVTIPESCSLTSTVTTAHTATIENGVYNDAIG